MTSKKLSNNELPSLIGEAENFLTQTQPVPTKLVSNHNRAQTVLNKAKEKLLQRQAVLKKLLKDWQTYEDKKTLVESTIDASKKMKFGPDDKISTEDTLKTKDVSQQKYFFGRRKFSFSHT